MTQDELSKIPPGTHHADFEGEPALLVVYDSKTQDIVTRGKMAPLIHTDVDALTLVDIQTEKEEDLTDVQFGDIIATIEHGWAKVDLSPTGCFVVKDVRYTKKGFHANAKNKTPTAWKTPPQWVLQHIGPKPDPKYSAEGMNELHTYINTRLQYRLGDSEEYYVKLHKLDELIAEIKTIF